MLFVILHVSFFSFRLVIPSRCYLVSSILLLFTSEGIAGHGQFLKIFIMIIVGKNFRRDYRLIIITNLQGELFMLKERARLPDVAPAELVRSRPKEPPLVLTKEVVEKMVRENASLNRANFKLITRGFGPIGAPTMSIEEALST